MDRTIIFVGIAGLLGSISRYLLTFIVVKALPFTFPAGTFTVNIIGCFVMGAVVGFAERVPWFHHQWRIILTAGFCGGFTTFSAFAFENVELILDKNYLTFGAYSLASFIICLAATFAGLFLTRS